MPYVSVLCGQCRYCRAGYYALCESTLNVGHVIDGGFASYIIAQDDQVFRLPNHIDLDVGSLSEPLACAVQAVSELSHVEPGDTVLISGPGPVGLMTLQLAKAQGANTVVAGLASDGERLAVAREMGADIAVNVAEGDLNALVRGASGGYGADFAFECAGTDTSLQQCLGAVRKLGSVVLLGLHGKSALVDPNLIVNKQLLVRGSISHTWGTWDRTMAILADGLVNLRPLISHTLPLSQWQEGFRISEERTGLKVLLQPD